MTDSTIDEKSGQRAVGVTPSADDLFGEIGRDEPLEEEPIERRSEGRDDRGEIEDRTASDVFDQLRAETTDDDADALLGDESPADIIASADEADEDGDDDLLVDEDELEDLLLTGRTEGEEFLWIDSPDTDESADPTTADDRADAPVESSEPDEDASLGVDSAAEASVGTPVTTTGDGVDDDAARLAALSGSARDDSRDSQSAGPESIDDETERATASSIDEPGSADEPDSAGDPDSIDESGDSDSIDSIDEPALPESAVGETEFAEADSDDSIDSEGSDTETVDRRSEPSDTDSAVENGGTVSIALLDEERISEADADVAPKTLFGRVRSILGRLF